MPVAPGSLAVLAVEDERLNIDLLRLVFEPENIEARIVTTGTTAIDAAARGEFDLVLLNVQLPDIGGVEVARRIRRLPEPAARVPILGCSAFAAASDEDNALEAGMTAYLVKPAPPTVLLAAIRAVAATRGEVEAPRSEVVAALLADPGPVGAQRFVDAILAVLVRLGRPRSQDEPAATGARLEELAASLRRLGLEATAEAVADAAAFTPAPGGLSRAHRIAGEAPLWRACVLGMRRVLRDATRHGPGMEDRLPRQ